MQTIHFSGLLMCVTCFLTSQSALRLLNLSVNCFCHSCKVSGCVFSGFPLLLSSVQRITKVTFTHCTYRVKPHIQTPDHLTVQPAAHNKTLNIFHIIAKHFLLSLNKLLDKKAQSSSPEKNQFRY